MALKEGFAGANELVPEGPKVGAIADFLGENISVVDIAGNVFNLDLEVLLLALEEFFSRRCTSLSMHGCRCRRQWIGRCLSCQDWRIGVRGIWCILCTRLLP